MMIRPRLLLVSGVVLALMAYMMILVGPPGNADLGGRELMMAKRQVYEFNLQVLGFLTLCAIANGLWSHIKPISLWGQGRALDFFSAACCTASEIICF